MDLAQQKLLLSVCSCFASEADKLIKALGLSHLRTIFTSGEANCGEAILLRRVLSSFAYSCRCG